MNYFLIGGSHHRTKRDIDERMSSFIIPIVLDVAVTYVPFGGVSQHEHAPVETYYKTAMHIKGRQSREFFMHSDLSPEEANRLMWDLLWECAK